MLQEDKVKKKKNIKNIFCKKALKQMQLKRCHISRQYNGLKASRGSAYTMRPGGDWTFDQRRKFVDSTKVGPWERFVFFLPLFFHFLQDCKSLKDSFLQHVAVIMLMYSLWLFHLELPLEAGRCKMFKHIVLLPHKHNLFIFDSAY